MRKIKLTQGQYAIVDDGDFERLNKYKWHALEEGNTWYAKRGELPQIRMHRMILGLVKDDGKITDHINRNGLDNRRANLRVISNIENLRNRGLSARNTSRYNGVSWCKQTKKWRATIATNNKQVHLGRFNDIEDAVKARRLAEKHYWIDGNCYISPQVNANNTSGYTGIYWSINKWRARISVNNKPIHLGYFDNIKDAITSRKLGEDKYWAKETSG